MKVAAHISRVTLASLIVSIGVAVFPHVMHAQQCVNHMLVLGENRGYMAVPSSATLKIDGGDGGLTIECWAKADAVVERSGLIEKTNSDDRVNYALTLGPDNTIVARITTISGAISHSTPSLSNLTQWHHYAMVFRPGDSLYLFVDGERMYPAKKVAATLLQTGDDSLRVGISTQPGASHFTGSIDEVRVWKTARTDQQIFDNYRRVLATDTHIPSLSAYYTFDDVPTSRRVYDFSRRNNNGGLKQTTSIAPSTAPILGVAKAYKLQSKERSIVFRTQACRTIYDTTVSVRNLGLDSVNVNAFGLTYGKAFSIAGPERLILPADSSFYGAIRIQFNPMQAGAGSGPKFFDTLIVSSNEVCAGTIKIPLEAEYYKTGISLNTTVLSYESVLNCELPSTPITVTIKNQGSLPTTIEDAWFTQPLGVDVTYPRPIPFVIPAGGSEQVQLRVNPAASGRVEGQLVFRSSTCQETAGLTIVIDRQDITYVTPAKQTFADRIIRDVEVSFDTVIPFVNTSPRMIVIERAEITLGSQFTLVDPIFNLTVQPGDTAWIPVRFSSRECGEFAGTLKMYGRPCVLQPKVDLAVSVISLPLSAAQRFDAGFFCSVRDTTIEIRNPFDQAVTIRWAQIDRPQRVTLGSAFVFPFTLAPDSAVRLPLRFLASITGELEAQLQLHHGLCGKTTVDLTGSVGTERVAYHQNVVSFGQGCDTTIATRRVWLHNRSERPLPLGGSTIMGSPRFLLVTALPKFINANDSLALDIRYKPVMGRVETATLNITTSDNCTIEPLSLRGSRENPNVLLQTSRLDFDTVCPTTAMDLPIEFLNIGIDSVPVSGFAVSGSNAFSVLTGPALLPPGKSQVVVRFLPGVIAEYSGSLTISFGSCRAPFTVDLQGSGGATPTLTLSHTVVPFGEVDVLSSKTLCIDVYNPSCVPVTLTESSFGGFSNELTLADETRAALPHVIGQEERMQVCFVYTPTAMGVMDREIALHADPADTVFVRVTGQGFASDVAFEPQLVDFGYVLIGEPATEQVVFTNNGNRSATVKLRYAMISSHYQAVVETITIPAYGRVSVPITFKPLSEGLHEATIEVEHSGRTELLSLRGVGAEKGISLEVTQLDFGPVRVGASAERTLRVSSNFQPLRLDSAVAADGVSSEFTILNTGDLPFNFATAGDAIDLRVRFTPTQERTVSSSLLFWTDNNKLVSLPVTGLGVEAHLATPEELDFGVTQIEEVTTEFVTISNTGDHPLTIESAGASSPFTVIAYPTLIPPGESADIEISYTPLTTKQIVGSLIVIADAPESPDTVVLRGRGGDLPQGRPRIAYTLPDNLDLTFGDKTLIPVGVTGNRLGDIRFDTLDVTVAYDPSMLYFSGAETFGTQLDGCEISWDRLSDSIIRFRAIGKAITPSISTPLLYLSAEALLGPNERSVLELVGAAPASASSLNDARSTVTVQNCKDSAVSVIYRGEYAVLAPRPFPTRDRATFVYKLGLPGDVTIDCYDNLGRPVGRLYEASKPKGEHEAHVDLSSLRVGHYTYVFRGLEYVTRGSIVIQR